MKRFRICFCLVAVCSIFVHGALAAETPSPTTGTPATASDAVVSTKITVTKDDCAQLTAVVPADGGAYTPGVDVNGNPVAPADLNGVPSPFAVPQNIIIDFGVDIAKRYGLDALGYTATSKLWTVNLKDGKLYVDGKPLKGEDAEAIAKACRRAYGP